VFEIVDQNVSKARIGSGAPGWLVMGLLVGWLGYLAITGSACGEGLAAAIAGGVTGAIWAWWSARRSFRRGGRFVGGLLSIACVTVLAGLIGRSTGPGMIFHRAFGVAPDAKVQFVEIDRFGYMDNTSLLILKTDEQTLRGLVDRAGFSRDEEAEQSLAGHEAQYFRRKASIDGVFAEKMPYQPGLKVYQRKISKYDVPVANMAVTWDPEEQKAYVVVAEY
jgi:hypothetical protein